MYFRHWYPCKCYRPILILNNFVTVCGILAEFPETLPPVTMAITNAEGKSVTDANGEVVTSKQL